MQFTKVIEVLEGMIKRYELSGEGELSGKQYRSFISDCDSIVSQVNEVVSSLDQSLDSLKAMIQDLDEGKRLIIDSRVEELREGPLYDTHRNFFMMEEGDTLPSKAFKCFVQRCDCLAAGIVKAVESIKDIESDLHYLGLEG